MTADKPFLTIAYITSREEPRFEWFVDSLFRIVPPEELSRIQILFIDHHLWAKDLVDDPAHPDGDWIDLRDSEWHDVGREIKLAQAVFNRFEFTHIPPKPTVWQGPFRLTKVDWFAAANARNTAVIFAKADWLVVADDLSVLTANWWTAVKEAVIRGGVTCGAYKKVKNLKVIDGELVGFEEYPHGNDHRMKHASGFSGALAAPPGWFYGCSFCAPVEAFLRIGGWPELCDGLSYEDSITGITMAKQGYEFYYDPRMLTLESEEGHHVGVPMRREDPGQSPNDKSHAMLERYSKVDRFENYFEPGGIRFLRDSVLAGGKVPIMRNPQHEWFTGKRLREL